MNSSLAIVLGGLSVFALGIAQSTGQSWLLIGALAGLALYFFGGATGNEKK